VTSAFYVRPEWRIHEKSEKERQASIAKVLGRTDRSIDVDRVEEI
jgi:hypothetical protein